MKPIEALDEEIISCRKCPRLVRYLQELKLKYPYFWHFEGTDHFSFSQSESLQNTGVRLDTWCRPVPGFGDPQARIWLIGLAPGRFGSNRTGRMFTGDASGHFLYPILHRVGLANQPKAYHCEDGLKLKGAFISSTVRCVPPQNKPLPNEISNCIPFLKEELVLLKKVCVVVALGRIAHDEYVRIRVAGKKGRLADYPFAHGAVYEFPENPKYLIDTYHPSRQNTNTGRLTQAMFLRIFRKAVRLAR